MITKPVALWGSGLLVVAALGGSVVYALTTSVTPAATSGRASTAGAGNGNGNNGNGNNGNGNNGNGNGNGGSTDNSNPGHPITLTGSVVGQVRPGTPATLNVTISNPNNQAIVVTSVTGIITSATSAGLSSSPTCSPSWYSIGTFTGSKNIAKNGSGIVSVPISLSDLPGTNQDNCKGAIVYFAFTAQARQA